MSEQSNQELAAIFQPRTFEEALNLAERLAKTKMVPKEYEGNPDGIMIAMATGAHLGLHWTQALTSIAVFDGKPTLYGDVGLALVRQSGLLESIEEWDDPAIDGGTALCKVKRKNGDEATRTYSMMDAGISRVYYKDKDGNRKWYPLSEKPVWKSNPRRMRQWRARWWALRDVFPDVLKGVIGREEIVVHEPTDSTTAPDSPPEHPENGAAGLPMPEAIRTAEEPKTVDPQNELIINDDRGAAPE